MDARVYFQLVDSITAAANATELSVIRATITATDMHRLEREALERSLAIREQLLRTDDVEVNRPAGARGD